MQILTRIGDAYGAKRLVPIRRVHCGGDSVGLQEKYAKLGATVRKLKDDEKTANPDLGVVVKGADETDYQVMVNVMDTLRQLDITKMGLATE